MIPRYTPADFADLWSSKKRFETWLDVELAACESMEEAGLVPRGTAESIRPVRSKLNADRIDEIEATTKHDVIAFLTHVEELAGPPARYLHLGMTSSDVLDSSLAMLFRDALVRIDARLVDLLTSLERRIREHAKTPMIGRSHGIHAEPLTFGVSLASHYAELSRGRTRLQHAIANISVGKIAGAVGTYAHLSLQIEKRALHALGLEPETIATQVVARDRHAEAFLTMSLIAAGIERLATNIRHYQRTEVLEAEEAFTKGQKGSSAMPHKRNPILSENLCGLARMVRSTVVAALENVALWHERDISHSSVERMFIPDATATLAFMLERSTKLIDGLVVYPENLKKNLDKTGGLWASEGILLALVHSGVARQEAYVWVQRNAMRAFAGEAAFEGLLLVDPDIRAKLSEDKIREQFDLEHALAHVPEMIERALNHGGNPRH